MVSVLVVEDDYLLADELDLALSERGFHVVGPAPNLAIAQSLLAEHRIDVGCLDVRLGQETSVPVAQTLAALGVPFVFLTALPIAYLPLDMRHRPKLDKPVDPQLLAERLAALVGAVAPPKPAVRSRPLPIEAGRWRMALSDPSLSVRR
jgi:DNA-binding response OmpR family regulator